MRTTTKATTTLEPIRAPELPATNRTGPRYWQVCYLAITYTGERLYRPEGSDVTVLETPETQIVDVINMHPDRWIEEIADDLKDFLADPVVDGSAWRVTRMLWAEEITPARIH